MCFEFEVKERIKKMSLLLACLFDPSSHFSTQGKERTKKGANKRKMG